MGFFDIDELIRDLKAGNLEARLRDLPENDLAILKNEIEGYAKRVGNDADVLPLLKALEAAVQQTTG